MGKNKDRIARMAGKPVNVFEATVSPPQKFDPSYREPKAADELKADLNALANEVEANGWLTENQTGLVASALRRLAALEAGGMVLVPKEPTREMLDAAYKTYPDPSNPATAMLEIYYKVMLAARPQGGKDDHS